MTTKLVPKQSILRKSRTSTFRSRKSENHQWQISILHFTCCEKLDVLVASSAQIWVNLTLRTGCWWTTFCTFFVVTNFMDFWPSNPAGEQIWTCFMNIDKVCNKNVFFFTIFVTVLSQSLFLIRLAIPAIRKNLVYWWSSFPGRVLLVSRWSTMGVSLGVIIEKRTFFWFFWLNPW